MNTQTSSDLTVRAVMTSAPVIPVMVIDDPDTAVPLAQALVAGGLCVLEITLRTDAAFTAMERIAAGVPGAIVGVGTLTHPREVRQAMDHGARFAVSPGYTHELGDACAQARLPFLPGVMTPADIIRAMQDGLDALKFFPAAQAGGVSFLKALAGPFPNIVFCPTGGISASNYHEYLALHNVLCVGGSWDAPKKLVQDQQWEAITQLASACKLPADQA